MVSRARQSAAVLAGLVLLAVAGCALEETGSGDTGLNAGNVPDKYEDLVIEAGSQCKEITPAIIAAQIDIESDWDPDVTSTAGAQGIAQFMPTTWEAYGLDANDDGERDVWNPEDAIPSQGAYMCRIVGIIKGYINAGTVHGNVTKLALAGYNAGHGAVQQAGSMSGMSAGVQQYATDVLELAATTYAGAGGGTTNIGGGPIVAPMTKGLYIVQHSYGEGGVNWENYHTGEDLSASCGTPIFAAHSGVIVGPQGSESDWGGPYFFRITQGDGKLTTWYAHAQTLDVEPGDTVKAGQRVAEVGAYGNATGCHLHIEVHPNGGEYMEDDVDPVQWFAQQGVIL